MLASSVGPNLTKLLHDQLDLMFACGLSEPLRSALVSIARHIPPLLKTIQGAIYKQTLSNIDCSVISDRLLDLLSLILTGQSFRPLGAPSALGRAEAAKEVTIDVSTLVHRLTCHTGGDRQQEP